MTTFTYTWEAVHESDSTFTWVQFKTTLPTSGHICVQFSEIPFVTSLGVWG